MKMQVHCFEVPFSVFLNIYKFVNCDFNVGALSLLNGLIRHGLIFLKYCQHENQKI